MSIKIAKRLNSLLAASQTVGLSVDATSTRLTGPGTDALREQIESVFAEVLPAGNAAEVRAAAAERRDAICYEGRRYFADGQDRAGGALFAAQLSARAIDGLIDAHNASTLAAYEAYRLACEQGVAVEPV